MLLVQLARYLFVAGCGRDMSRPYLHRTVVLPLTLQTVVLPQPANLSCYRFAFKRGPRSFERGLVDRMADRACCSCFFEPVRGILLGAGVVDTSAGALDAG